MELITRTFKYINISNRMADRGNWRVILEDADWSISETYVRASSFYDVAQTILERKEAREKAWKILAVKAPTPEPDEDDRQNNYDVLFWLAGR